jgi:fibronectin-binding autotransporter adhesin
VSVAGLLDAANGVTFTVGGIIAGSGDISINGGAGHAGIVALTGANTFSGNTTVSDGTLQLGNALAMQNSTINLQHGTLDFGALTAATIGGLSGTNVVNLTNATAASVALTIGNNDTTATTAGIVGGTGSLRKLGAGVTTLGSGVAGGAAYTGSTRIDNGTLAFGGAGNMNATGNLDISGAAGICNMVVGDNATATFSGAVLLGDGASSPSAGTLTVKNNAQLNAASLNFGNGVGRVAQGTSVTVQDNAVLNISGSFDIQDAFSSQAVTDVLNLKGGSLMVSNFLASAASAVHQSVISFNGGLLIAGAADPDGSSFLPAFAGLSVNVTNTTPAMISTSFTNTIAAALTNGTANPDGGLVKLGTGALYLLGPNNYTGLTIVSNGTLYISTALQSGNESFVVNDGKAFGVVESFGSLQSAMIANLTLGHSSGPTTLTFTNIGDPVPVIIASGTVTLNGNNTIKIADAANLVAGTEYPLIQYASILTNGGAGFNLSLPHGMVAFLTNDTSISAIALKVISLPVIQPVFGSISTSGSDLVLNAAGGKPNGSVTVLTSTDVLLPLNQWTPVAAGNFDGAGNFSFTVTGALSSGVPKQFYILQAAP